MGMLMANSLVLACALMLALAAVLAPTGAALVPTLAGEPARLPSATETERDASDAGDCVLALDPNADRLEGCAATFASHAADAAMVATAPALAWVAALPGRASDLPTEFQDDAAWLAASAQALASAGVDNAVSFVLNGP